MEPRAPRSACTSASVHKGIAGPWSALAMWTPGTRTTRSASRGAFHRLWVMNPPSNHIRISASSNRRRISATCTPRTSAISARRSRPVGASSTNRCRTSANVAWYGSGEAGSIPKSSLLHGGSTAQKSQSASSGRFVLMYSAPSGSAAAASRSPAAVILAAMVSDGTLPPKPVVLLSVSPVLALVSAVLAPRWSRSDSGSVTASEQGDNAPILGGAMTGLARQLNDVTPRRHQ